MNNEQHAYLKLAEEANEVSKEAMKVMQFGANTKFGFPAKSNKERLHEEIDHLFAHIQLLNEKYDLGYELNPAAVKEKLERAEEMRKVSTVLGQLKE